MLRSASSEFSDIVALTCTLSVTLRSHVDCALHLCQPKESLTLPTGCCALHCTVGNVCIAAVQRAVPHGVSKPPQRTCGTAALHECHTAVGCGTVATRSE